MWDWTIHPKVWWFLGTVGGSFILWAAVTEVADLREIRRRGKRR